MESTQRQVSEYKARLAARNEGSDGARKLEEGAGTGANTPGKPAGKKGSGKKKLAAAKETAKAGTESSTKPKKSTLGKSTDETTIMRVTKGQAGKAKVVDTKKLGMRSLIV